MSTPSPLQPQGTIDGAPKSRVRITVLTILALHVVFVGGLLMQGCDRKGSPTTGSTADAASNTLATLPPLNSDTNYYTAPPTDAFSTTGGAAAPAGASTSTGAGAIPPAQTGLGAPASASHTGVGTGTGTLPPAGSTSPGLGVANSPYPGVTQDSTALPHNTLPPPSTFSSTTTGGQTTEHVIKKGDLIRDLAKKYGVTEQAILDANPGIKPRNLKVNDKIAIPAPSAAAAAPSASAPAHASTADAPAAGGETYVVKPGDNLTKIAKRFGVTVAQIRAANNLRNDRIVAKQSLKIPARTSPRQEPAATGGAPAI